MRQAQLFDSIGWEKIEDGLIYWDPDFLNSKQAQYYFEQLRKTLPWQQLPIQMFGKTVMQPRLQAWFGHSYTYSGLQLTALPLPSLLTELKQSCEQVAETSFNSVLANLYRDGSDYMGWHQDNEKELGTEPVIASLSFGETRRFQLRHIHTKEKKEFILNQGALLIMAGGLQSNWQHCIPKTAKMKDERINLTFRKIKHLPK